MMAARRVALLLLPACVLFHTGSSLAPGQAPASEEGPHFTACLSREQETFRCWWSTGSFRNLSEPGALRVFFWKKNSMPKHWIECPDYTSFVANECYFNKSYTSIWTSYCVQLRSQSQNVTYDERCFNVEDIVHPDPPVGLNWTLLNVSRSGLHFDVIVRWDPPPSADVKAGWMSLVYEVHYRERNASRWDTLELETATQQSLYGLQLNVEYEVRVRCKMRSFDNFGDFSDSIFVHVPHIPTKESTYPLTFVLIFGAVGMAILLLLVIFSQQQRLMVILLPPVPAPKIKGIDPDLLKKGRLDDLSSALSSQPLYKPEMYHEEPWVEFIEVDLDVEVSTNSGSSDKQHLLDLGPHFGSALRLGVKDDDSGRASCYDPELQETDPDVSIELCQGPEEDMTPSSGPQTEPTSPGPPPEGLAPSNRPDGQPLIQTQLSTQSWASMDLYAQVSDVTPTGGVMLSPGQQIRVPEKSQEEKKKEENSQHPKKEKEGEKKEEGKGRKKESFQLLIVVPDSGAYTSESNARQMSSDCCSRLGSEGPATQVPQPPAEKNSWNQLSLTGFPVGEYQSPYCLPPAAPLMPVSDYTVVQDVDAQHSLLLNPSSHPAPAVAPTKSQPAVPAGYLTPDLLSNLSL